MTGTVLPTSSYVPTLSGLAIRQVFLRRGKRALGKIEAETAGPSRPGYSLLIRAVGLPLLDNHVSHNIQNSFNHLSFIVSTTYSKFSQ